MKRIISIVLALALMFSLSACSAKYVSSYTATVFVGNAWDGTVTAEIDSFSGRYVWRLGNPNKSDTDIYYTASLASGDMRVYYDSTTSGSDKRALFSINGNGIAEGRGGYVTVGGEVYIIIESVGDEPLRDVSLYISFKE